MDRGVLLTSTPECVVSSRGKTTHEEKRLHTLTHDINPDYNMMLEIYILIYQYSAY